MCGGDGVEDEGRTSTRGPPCVCVVCVCVCVHVCVHACVCMYVFVCVGLGCAGVV